MKMAVLEGSRGVGDNATEIRIPLSGWTLIRITGLVSGTTAEVHENRKKNSVKCGWRRDPPPHTHTHKHIIVKHFVCTAIHNKALYKCILHSFKCLYCFITWSQKEFLDYELFLIILTLRHNPLNPFPCLLL